MINGVVNPTGDEAVTLAYYAHGQADKLSNVARRPAVLVLPGGGYEHCSDRESEPVALSFLGAGYQAFVLRYSLGERSAWPRPLADAEAAMQTIIDHADQWGVDPDRIVVAGFSAGGHLAASLGVFGRIRPARLILIYPVTTEDTLKVCVAASHNAPDLLAAVDAGTPATFLAHTADDETVPVTDSLAFAERLHAANVPFELHVFPSGPHGLALGTAFTSTGRPEMENPGFAQWLGLAVNWLRREFPIG